MCQIRTLPVQLKLWDQQKGGFGNPDAGVPFRGPSALHHVGAERAVSPPVTVCGTQDGKRPWSPEPGSQGVRTGRQPGLGNPGEATGCSGAAGGEHTWRPRLPGAWERPLLREQNQTKP